MESLTLNQAKDFFIMGLVFGSGIFTPYFLIHGFLSFFFYPTLAANITVWPKNDNRHVVRNSKKVRDSR